MNLSFLFGAGISIPSGVAKTCDITDRVFSGLDVIRHTDGSFYVDKAFPVEPKELYLNNIDSIIQFLAFLKDLTDNYYRKYTNRKWNYEDLYYLVEELYQEVSGDTDNPMAKHYLDYLEPPIQKFFKSRDSESRNLNDLLEFFSEVKNYIKCIVRDMLGFSIIRGLDFLSDIYNDKDIHYSNIFSLNHDLLLESYFASRRIEINDGFSKAVNNVRYWEPSSYLNECKIKLFKIHGSVNWYRLGKDGSDWHDEGVRIVEDGNIFHSLDLDGDSQFPCDTYPLILVGTFNKLAEYSSGIFMDLICLFNKNLNTSDNLIISGYSFGDKGVNARITEWAYKSRNKRIVIIDPDLNTLKNNARGSIRNKWDSWIQTDKMHTIEKGIQDVSWYEIKSKLVI